MPRKKLKASNGPELAAQKSQASTSSITPETRQNVPKCPLPFPLETPRTQKSPLERQIRIQKFEQDALRDRINRIDLRIALNHMARGQLAGPVSPLIALPDEVIRAVFVFVYDDADAGSHSRIFLSHICRRWRAIALDYPAMWSIICVRGLHSAQLLELYLERSCRTPLQGSIDLVTECSADLAKLTLFLLRGSITRFRQLYIKCPDNGFVKKILEPLQEASESSQLQTLEICSDDIEDETEEGESSSPDLRCLHPRSLLIDTLGMLVLGPNTDALYNLQIEGGSTYAMLSYREIYEILSRSGQNLTCLSIGSEILERFSSLQTEMAGIVGQYSSGMYLPNLTHFRCADSTFAPTIAWFMSAPKLEVIILKDMPLAEIFPNTRISPVLHTLALIDCPTTSKSHDMVHFAESTQNIRHLYILHSSPDKSTFDEMLYQLPEHAMWPRLDTLTIDLAKLREYPRQCISLETLLDMRSRTQEVSKPLLRVFEGDVELWKTAVGSLWDEVESMEEVKVLAEERRSCCIPWPPRDDRVFISPSSEVEFQI